MCQPLHLLYTVNRWFRAKQDLIDQPPGQIRYRRGGYRGEVIAPLACPWRSRQGPVFGREWEMGRVFIGKDSRSWKVVGKDGKVLRAPDGRLMNSFDGYKSANEAARAHGGTAVRV